mmetsp:Transcript_85060/g.197781  ORF Transcript_85060/g.197781 Transcript_85060/m.197781 type:complete len:284 (+) Transcript_85060:935-1786(+)
MSHLVVRVIASECAVDLRDARVQLAFGDRRHVLSGDLHGLGVVRGVHGIVDVGEHYTLRQQWALWGGHSDAFVLHGLQHVRHHKHGHRWMRINDVTHSEASLTAGFRLLHESHELVLINGQEIRLCVLKLLLRLRDARQCAHELRARFARTALIGAVIAADTSERGDQFHQLLERGGLHNLIQLQGGGVEHLLHLAQARGEVELHEIHGVPQQHFFLSLCVAPRQLPQDDLAAGAGEHLLVGVGGAQHDASSISWLQQVQRNRAVLGCLHERSCTEEAHATVT